MVISPCTSVAGSWAPDKCTEPGIRRNRITCPRNRCLAGDRIGLAGRVPAHRKALDPHHADSRARRECVITSRNCDYYLGGKDNYAVDRAAVEEALKVWPDMAFTARANRGFLGRAVRHLAGEAGIRQFLDIGTGIPTADNAQAIAPECRVVYVDYDRCKLGCAHGCCTSSMAIATSGVGS